MDTEQIELFPAMEYVDLSHSMTARSTKSKRTIEHPMTGWEDTNQPPLNAEKRSPSSRNAIASQQSETPIAATDLETRIRWANELRKASYSNL